MGNSSEKQNKCDKNTILTAIETAYSNKDKAEIVANLHKYNSCFPSDSISFAGNSIKQAIMYAYRTKQSTDDCRNYIKLRKLVTNDDTDFNEFLLYNFEKCVTVEDYIYIREHSASTNNIYKFLLQLIANPVESKKVDKLLSCLSDSNIKLNFNLFIEFVCQYPNKLKVNENDSDKVSIEKIMFNLTPEQQFFVYWLYMKNLWLIVEEDDYYEKIFSSCQLNYNLVVVKQALDPYQYPVNMYTPVPRSYRYSLPLPSAPANILPSAPPLEQLYEQKYQPVEELPEEFEEFEEIEQIGYEPEPREELPDVPDYEPRRQLPDVPDHVPSPKKQQILLNK